jgi:hypothetical protein
LLQSVPPKSSLDSSGDPVGLPRVRYVSPEHVAPGTPVVPSERVEPAVAYTVHIGPLRELARYGGHVPGPDMLPLAAVDVTVGGGGDGERGGGGDGEGGGGGDGEGGGGGDGEGGGGGDGEGGGEAVGVTVGVVHAPGVAMLTL